MGEGAVDFSDGPPFAGIQITTWANLSYFQPLVPQCLGSVPACKTNHAVVRGTSSEFGNDFRSDAFMRKVELLGFHHAPAAFALALSPFAGGAAKVSSLMFSTPSSCGIALTSSPLKKHCTY